VSIPQESPQIIRNAVVWFNNLKPEEQSLLVAKLGDPEYSFTSEQTNNLTILALFITNSSNTATRGHFRSARKTSYYNNE